MATLKELAGKTGHSLMSGLTTATDSPLRGKALKDGAIIVPLAQFDGAKFAKLQSQFNLKQEFKAKTAEFVITERLATGAEKLAPAEGFASGLAELSAIPTKVKAIQTALNLTAETFGELMNRFNGSYPQRLLAVVNRYDVMTASGTVPTVETLKPAAKTKPASGTVPTVETLKPAAKAKPAKATTAEPAKGK